MMVNVMVRTLVASLCMVVVLGLAQPVYASALDIDTRIGQAQQFKSYVYDSVASGDTGVVQVPKNLTTSFYGDVEFKKGIRANITGSFAQTFVELGVTPPINGIIEVEDDGGDPALWLNFMRNTEFGSLTFTGNGLWTGEDAPHFSLYIDDYCTVALNDDLLLTGTYEIQITAAEGATLDGRGNTIYLAPGGEWSGHIFGPHFYPGVTDLHMKNLRIDGITEYNFYVPGSQVSEALFENVQFRVASGQNTASVFGRRDSTFRGPGNMLYGGGTFEFIKDYDKVPISMYDRIEENSRLYVAPNTCLRIGYNDLYAYVQSYDFLFDGETSELFLDNCVLSIGVNGSYANLITFMAGTMTINGVVTLQSVNGGKLQIGDGIDAANNFHINILPGSKLIIDNGATLINKNVD